MGISISLKIVCVGIGVWIHFEIWVMGVMRLN